jgi:hypothetical protein
MSLPARWRRLRRRERDRFAGARADPEGRSTGSQSGQALVEQGILLATLLGGLAVGGVWLMKTHPQMLRMFDIQIRSYYFMLSLPFP